MKHLSAEDLDKRVTKRLAEWDAEKANKMALAANEMRDAIRAEGRRIASKYGAGPVEMDHSIQNGRVNINVSMVWR